MFVNHHAGDAVSSTAPPVVSAVNVIGGREVSRTFEKCLSCGEHTLKGPNDIVFAPKGSPGVGGFWFSDLGKVRARDRDHGSAVAGAADGALAQGADAVCSSCEVPEPRGGLGN